VEDRDEKRRRILRDAASHRASETFGPERLSLSRLLGRDPGVKQKLQWMTYAELQAERARLAALLSHPPTRKSTPAPR